LGHPQVNHNILVVLSYESHRYLNGSAVPNLTNGKYVLFTTDFLGDLFTISQLRCRYMSDSYIYITQQDAPHKDKLSYLPINNSLYM
jgi:hypothetical protein